MGAETRGYLNTPNVVVPGSVGASDIANIPAGNIAATDVQAAINELDTEKVAKAGDTMTGALVINAGTGSQLIGGQTSSVFGTGTFIDFLTDENLNKRVEVKNASAGTGSSMLIACRSDTSQFILRSFSSGNTGATGLAGILGSIPSANLVQLTAVTSNILAIGLASATPVGFYTNNLMRVVIDSSGLMGVGIATTPSNGFLQLPASTTLATGGIAWGTDTNLYRSAADVLKTDDKFITVAGLGVGNSAVASVAVGTLANKMEVFDAAGASLGFVPIYATIT